jgi:hypothetical protein
MEGSRGFTFGIRVEFHYGFPALFYQTHWEFFEEEICNAVRVFISGGEVPEGFCDSVIVLIPKVTKPKHLKNFRPISLCNVIYRSPPRFWRID